MSPTGPRADEIGRGLERVRGRIAAAAGEAGRDPDEVTLIVVTKFFPASDVRLLAELGVTDVGENRHQEAEAKAAELHDVPLTWHFVGTMQSNKATAVAQYADVVHSVDRVKLLDGLSRGAHQRGLGRPLPCLVQVDLDPDPKPGRGGAVPADVGDLADAVDAAEGLRLRGLMAVAPLGADPAEAFSRLADLALDVRRRHPDARWLSAGMSGDLEEAVKAGATHVRVGSAVLGERPSNR
jgi:pyridoxal phosphate enzyme (YggS family)